MKTAEDWVRKIEADPSTRVFRKWRGGVMAASELWALAQTLGGEVMAALYGTFGVDIYVKPTGDFTVFMRRTFQAGRGCLASQTVPRIGEAGYQAVEEPPRHSCPQCARPNPIVDEGGVRCWWCGYQAQTVEQYREGP